METQTAPEPGLENPGASATAEPDLVGLADSLARKHAAGPTSRPPASPGLDKKTGRPRHEDIAARWLREKGLQAVPATGNGPEIPPDTGAGYVVDPAFVRQMAQMALKGVEAYRQRATYLRAVTIGADKALAKELAEGNGAPPGAIEVISCSLAEISQKYGWLSQWTPEVAVIIAIGAWTAKDLATMQRLRAIGRESENLTKEEKP